MQDKVKTKININSENIGNKRGDSVKKFFKILIIILLVVLSIALLFIGSGL